MVNNLKHNKSIKSLSMQNSEKIHPFTLYSKGTKTLPCIWEKGSMTVEAAMVVPLFVFCLALFLGIFRVLQVETQMEQALNYAAGRAAVYGEAKTAGKGLKLADAAAGKLLLEKSLKNQKCPSDYLKRGYSGITLLSKSDEIYIRYQVTYTILLPVGGFGKESVTVTQGAVSRKWNGWEDEQNPEETWVYITKSGKAYHKSTSCRYLDLSIREAAAKDISKLRNKDGAVYYACGSCAKKASQGTVYITDYGTLYHGSLRCSKLKRTVYRVLLTQAGEKTPCKKCYGG